MARSWTRTWAPNTGDHVGIAAFGGNVHPIGTDRRVGGTVDGFEETYSATITVN